MADKVPTTSEGVPAPVQLEFEDSREQQDVITGKVGLGEQLGDRAGIVRELFAFLWARRLWWLAPMVLVLLFFGVLMVIASSSPVGAFIYTLF